MVSRYRRHSDGEKKKKGKPKERLQETAAQQSKKLFYKRPDNKYVRL